MDQEAVQVLVAPTEGKRKDCMEFGERGFTAYEQAPLHQRAHAAEHDAKLINCRGRCGRFRHAGMLPKPAGFASHLTSRNLPLSQEGSLRLTRRPTRSPGKFPPNSWDSDKDY